MQHSILVLLAMLITLALSAPPFLDIRLNSELHQLHKPKPNFNF